MLDGINWFQIRASCAWVARSTEFRATTDRSDFDKFSANVDASDPCRKSYSDSDLELCLEDWANPHLGHCDILMLPKR